MMHNRILRAVHWLCLCASLRIVQAFSDQSTTLSTSDLHNARSTSLNPFSKNSLDPDDNRPLFVSKLIQNVFITIIIENSFMYSFISILHDPILIQCVLISIIIDHLLVSSLNSFRLPLHYNDATENELIIFIVFGLDHFISYICFIYTCVYLIVYWYFIVRWCSTTYWCLILI